MRAGADGFVERIVARPGCHVRPGDVLIICRDPQLVTQARMLEYRLEELQTRYTAEWLIDISQAQIIKDEIAHVEERLARARERVDDLVIRSRAEGIFETAGSIASLTGRFVRQGASLGYVLRSMPPLTARVVVPEAEGRTGAPSHAETSKCGLVDRPSHVFHDCYQAGGSGRERATAEHRLGQPRRRQDRRRSVRQSGHENHRENFSFRFSAAVACGYQHFRRPCLCALRPRLGAARQALAPHIEATFSVKILCLAPPWKNRRRARRLCRTARAERRAARAILRPFDRPAARRLHIRQLELKAFVQQVAVRGGAMKNIDGRRLRTSPRNPVFVYASMA